MNIDNAFYVYALVVPIAIAVIGVIAWLTANGSLKSLVVKLPWINITVGTHAPRPTRRPLPPPKPPKPLQYKPGKAFLAVKQPGVKDENYALYQNVFAIGSAKDNQLPISNDGTIGERHAILYLNQKSGRYFIKSLGNRRTFVNGGLIYQPAKLGNGDKITIGGCTLIFRQLPNTTK